MRSPIFFLVLLPASLSFVSFSLPSLFNVHDDDSNRSSKLSARPPSPPLHLPFPLTLSCLEIFHSSHGHLQIPHSFTCLTPSYPEIFSGVKLADVVYRMSWYRENLTPSRPHLTEDECRERKRKLSEIGFVWGRLQSKWDVGVGVGVGAGVGAGAGVGLGSELGSSLGGGLGGGLGVMDSSLGGMGTSSLEYMEVVDVENDFVVPLGRCVKTRNAD